VVDRLGLQGREAGCAVAANFDHVVVDELAHALKPRLLVFPVRVGLDQQAAKEAVDLVAAVGVAEMAEDQVAVLGEEARNLGELSVVDVCMIEKAQAANTLGVAKLLHPGYEHAYAGLQIGGHKIGGHVTSS